MFNDDIFTLIMSAEESLLRAELGIDDAYEAYAMESSIDDTIAMESAYNDSYGWDFATEDAAAVAETNSGSQTTIGEKIKGAGKWMWNGILTIWNKLKEIWESIVSHVKAFFDKLFKRQKEISNAESEDVSSAPASTVSSNNSGAPRISHTENPRLATTSGSGNLPSVYAGASKNEIMGKGSAAPKSVAKTKAHLSTREMPGLPDHKEFNKSLPSIYSRNAIIEANRRNGVTESDVNNVRRAVDNYVKALFGFIEKSLNVSTTASQLMEQLRSLKFNTLNNDNKIKDFQNKFASLDEKISEIDDFNNETGSYKSEFNDAIKDVPHWTVYINAKTIHGFCGNVNTIYSACQKHLAFCKAFTSFIEKHKNDEAGTAYKNPQDLRVDGRTLSGGVVMGSEPTKLIYDGSKLYLRASTSCNKVIVEYKNLLSRIVGENQK